MSLKFLKNICLSCLALLIIFYPLKTDALSHDWVSVPKSQFGEQLWDKNSVQKNQDGSIRVFSKFLPKSTTEITQDILYTMDIDCSKNLPNSITRIFRRIYDKWHSEYLFFLFIGAISIRLVRLS